LELAGNVAFRDWLIHDREYLDEFRRIRKLEPHAEFVDGFIGFGEGVTARLENVVRPVHPARNLAR
jgi:hypothetical protein